MTDPLFINGKPEIALRLGCSKEKVSYYIEKEGLPAFQDVKGGWHKVTITALNQWAVEYQAKKQAKNPP